MVQLYFIYTTYKQQNKIFNIHAGASKDWLFAILHIIMCSGWTENVLTHYEAFNDSIPDQHNIAKQLNNLPHDTTLIQQYFR